MAAVLTLETFASHVGETFAITGTGIPSTIECPLRPFGPADLELTEVEDRSRAGISACSLLFRGPRAQEFGQANYQLTHESIGEVNLFLVPILDTRPVDDRICYQAIISRLKRNPSSSRLQPAITQPSTG